MNLEELNKTQVILLTLLVSFVTSIATGIVTVSLMAQAPQGITQTINRIVERTVEKVVPDSSGGKTQTITTTEKTVVVKEDDIAADSISRVKNSVIRIVAKGEADSAFYARGVVVDASASLAVMSKGVLDSTVPSEALLSNGVRVPFTVRKSDSSSVTVLELDLKNATTTKLSSVSLADLTKARLGQSVFLLSGKGRDSISQGVIAALPIDKGEGREAYIEATAVGTLPGAIIVNIFGDVVGMVTVESVGVDSGLYTPGKAIADALKTPVAAISGHSAP